ncbi:AEC family transporter [Bradyrhizobium japonicum]|uniref:AEC family transporter n=1 Tax=Bradyrhizobium japonicum TaxID=375 RepID=UPI00201261F8|nr:AEC family transporter [Bradyrhizobium japonicum]
MATLLIVAPVFALIAAGYAAVLFRFVSEGAHKGISEFAFSIAIPALLFRTIVVSEFPDVSPYRMWGAYYGALALTWIAALALSALLRARREDREDGVVFAIGSVYGNIVMLGIPLVLSALGNEAAGPMALILSVKTPLLWLCGILQMELVSRKRTGSAFSVIRPVLADLVRNPLMIAIGFGVIWRFTGSGLTPVVDRTIELLAQAGSPTALVALGINLFRFEVKGEKLSILAMCALKLAAMPAAAFVLTRLLDLPAVAAGVVVLFAAMPTGANAYIFAVQYQRLVNPVSGAVGHAAGGDDAAGGGVDGGGEIARSGLRAKARGHATRPWRQSTSISAGR